MWPTVEIWIKGSGCGGGDGALIVVVAALASDFIT